jgi:hypothetical protein
MPEIRPITDLRNTNEISGERQMALVDVYQKLAEAEKQIADGVPLLDGEEVFEKLRTK